MANTISCTEAISKLQAYLDNELGALTEADIDHHLHHCRECLSRADFEKALRKKVAESGTIETPAEVQARMASLIKRF